MISQVVTWDRHPALYPNSFLALIPVGLAPSAKFPSPGPSRVGGRGHFFTKLEGVARNNASLGPSRVGGRGHFFTKLEGVARNNASLGPSRVGGRGHFLPSWKGLHEITLRTRYKSHSFKRPTIACKSFFRFSNRPNMIKMATPMLIPNAHHGQTCSNL